MRLILASSSPRRAQVLRDAGFAFEAIPARADEAIHTGESPDEYVCRLAEAKARAVIPNVRGVAIVVGADTVVVVDGAILGKPSSAEDAREMLRRLSGRTHEVLTGLAVLRLPPEASQPAQIVQESTRVTFAALSPEEIEDYIASGEPFDKAGAYAIQGRGGRFVTRVEGCYFNVVGLPLARLYAALREFGWQESR